MGPEYVDSIRQRLNVENITVAMSLNLRSLRPLERKENGVK